MRQTVLLLLAGAIVGSLLTLGTIGVSGGLYSYTLLGPTECRAFGGTDFGSSEIAPGQPNPCLLRTPRFSLR